MFHWTEQQWNIGLTIGHYVIYPVAYWVGKRAYCKAKTSLLDLIGESVKKSLNGQLKELESKISKRLDEHESRLSAGDNRFERIEHLLDSISKDVKRNKRTVK